MSQPISKVVLIQRFFAGYLERLQAFQEESRRSDELKSVLRLPILVCAVSAFLFFGVFGVWAMTAPIAGGAVAQGTISPIGSRRTVQHLEGGIIEQILVRDGDLVKQGDALLVLAKTQAQASFQVYLDQRRTLAAMVARLESEQLGLVEVAYPSWLIASSEDHSTRKIMQTQQTLLESRRDTLDGQQEIQARRIAQLGEEIKGLEAQIAAQLEQLGLITEEIIGVEILFKKGLERASRLLSLKRIRSEIGGEKAKNEAGIARALQQIGEAEAQILNNEAGFKNEVATELNQLQYELTAVNEKMVASKDVLERTTLFSPISGTIVNKQFATTGGVIGPGQPVLDIVPEEEELIIEARLSPLDIDVVRKGLTAQVHLSAYSQRRLPQIHGTVRSVSADSLIDEITGEAYFKVEVEVDRDALQEIEKDFDIALDLSPGMPAEVLIVTGQRTLASYLLEPFSNSMRQSFREM